MRKNWKRLLCMLTMALMLTGCCSHEWEEADCEHPQTCSECGATQGEKGDHDWQKATCQQPKTCSVCGKEKGDLGDHKWKDATCTDPEICKTCGETRGSAEGHLWENTTCSRCGEILEVAEAPEAEPAAPAVDDGSLGIGPEDFVKEMVDLARYYGDGYSAGEVLEDSAACYIRNIDFQGSPAFKLILQLNKETGNVSRATLQQRQTGIPFGDVISLYVVPVALGRPGADQLVEVYTELSEAMTHQDAGDDMVYEIYEMEGYYIQIWRETQGESYLYEVEVFRPTVF